MHARRDVKVPLTVFINNLCKEVSFYEWKMIKITSGLIKQQQIQEKDPFFKEEMLHSGAEIDKLYNGIA